MVAAAEDGRLGLTEVINALRADLTAAAREAEREELQFPVQDIEISLEVAVTHEGEGHAGVKFWVVDLGASGSVSKEKTQTVTIRLGPPVRHTPGSPPPTDDVYVRGTSQQKP